MTLRAAVDRYRLTLGGQHVWAPYWLNSAHEPFRLDAPLRGKGSATELGRAARAAARAEAVAPQNSEEWRLLMRRHGLGVDCSGFAYHVLADWFLAQTGRPLADYLVVPAAEMEARNARVPELAVRWLAHGRRPLTDEAVPLARACSRWLFGPEAIVDVERLTHPQICRSIPTVGEAKPGDLIRTSHEGTRHIGVVVRVQPGLLTYADSAHSSQSLGGVKWRFMAVDHPEADLAEQSWGQRRYYHPSEVGSRDGLWRLNAVAEKCYGE